MFSGFRKKLKNRKGFSLVEVLIAVAIFCVVSIPMMSSFVVSSRLNYKSRVSEQAMTVAQNLMEGVKAFGLAELSEQCHTKTADEFTIIPGGDQVTASEEGTSSYAEGAFKAHAQVEMGTDATEVTLLNGEVIRGKYTVAGEAYVFHINNILIGSSYFDAKVTLKQDDTPEKNIATFADVKTHYDELKLVSYKYYDVSIEVYEQGMTNVVATYTGTVKDRD